MFRELALSGDGNVLALDQRLLAAKHARADLGVDAVGADEETSSGTSAVFEVCCDPSAVFGVVGEVFACRNVQIPPQELAEVDTARTEDVPGPSARNAAHCCDQLARSSVDHAHGVAVFYSVVDADGMEVADVFWEELDEAGYASGKRNYQ